MRTRMSFRLAICMDDRERTTDDGKNSGYAPIISLVGRRSSIVCSRSGEGLGIGVDHALELGGSGIVEIAGLADRLEEIALLAAQR
jgi:hypothetical protein